MTAPNVRCAGCGALVSTEFIRCALCKTPTRVSRLQAAQEAVDLDDAERMAARKRGCLIVPPVILALWALIWWLAS